MRWYNEPKTWAATSDTITVTADRAPISGGKPITASSKTTGISSIRNAPMTSGAT